MHRCRKTGCQKLGRSWSKKPNYVALEVVNEGRGARERLGPRLCSPILANRVRDRGETERERGRDRWRGGKKGCWFSHDEIIGVLRSRPLVHVMTMRSAIAGVQIFSRFGYAHAYTTAEVVQAVSSCESKHVPQLVPTTLLNPGVGVSCDCS